MEGRKKRSRKLAANPRDLASDGERRGAGRDIGNRRCTLEPGTTAKQEIRGGSAWVPMPWRGPANLLYALQSMAVAGCVAAVQDPFFGTLHGPPTSESTHACVCAHEAIQGMPGAGLTGRKTRATHPRPHPRRAAYCRLLDARPNVKLQAATPDDDFSNSSRCQMSGLALDKELGSTASLVQHYTLCRVPF